PPVYVCAAPTISAQSMVPTSGSHTEHSLVSQPLPSSLQVAVPKRSVVFPGTSAQARVSSSMQLTGLVPPVPGDPPVIVSPPIGPLPPVMAEPPVVIPTLPPPVFAEPPEASSPSPSPSPGESPPDAFAQAIKKADDAISTQGMK